MRLPHVTGNAIGCRCYDSPLLLLIWLTAWIACSGISVGSDRIDVVVLRWRSVLSTIGRRTGREQCWSTQDNVDLHKSSKLVLVTIVLKESNNGLMIMLKIQNFQFWSVRDLTYSSNSSFMWSNRCCVTGTPVAGSCCWLTLIEALSSSISSLRRLASSCSCDLSCCSFAIYSTVFCRVTALLIGFMLDWHFKVVTRLWRVSKPILMLNRLFCSAEIWVILRLLSTTTGCSGLDFVELFKGDCGLSDDAGEPWPEFCRSRFVGVGEGACLFEVGGVICSVLGCNRIVLGTTLVANKCDMADLTGCDVCREELITPGCCAGPTKILPWKSGTPEACNKTRH